MHQTLSLQRALEQAPTLAALKVRIEASQRCLELVRPLMAPGWRPLVKAGPLQDDEWCLLVENVAVLSKLRQLLPTMVQALHQNGMPVREIRLKVLAAVAR